MTILLTGGTGKTATRIGQLLQKAQTPFLIASRGGIPSPVPSGFNKESFVKFDFTATDSWTNPFEMAASKGSEISIVYLVMPLIPNATSLVNDFIDFAAEKHAIKRFVLMAGQNTEKGGVAHGEIWQHLDDIGVDYTVLGPSWFMENFSDPHQDYWQSIVSEDKIYSATGDGKMPLTCADDIAMVSFKLLTSNEPLQRRKQLILGPELLSMDQVAEKISIALDRPIKHVKLSQQDRVANLQKRGFTGGVNPHLPIMEAKTSEARDLLGFPDDTVRQVTGNEPESLDGWLARNGSSLLQNAMDDQHSEA